MAETSAVDSTQASDSEHWVSDRTGRPQNLTLPPSALWIILLPMFAYFCGDLFFENFANPNIVVSVPNTSFAPEAEAGNRYFFLTSYFALVATTIGICIYCSIDIWSTLTRRSFKLLLGVSILLSVLLACSVILRAGNSPKTFDFAGRALFAKALCESPLPKWQGNATDTDSKLGVLAGWIKWLGEHTLADDTTEKGLCQSGGRSESLASVFAALQKIDDFFIVIAVPAVILGCLSALARPGTHLPLSTEVYILSAQVKRLKLYLHLSALLLVILVVFLIAWMRFPSFLLDGAAAKRYEDLIRNISTYYGIQYVVLLCSYYIPISTLLSRRIRHFGYRAARDTSKTPNEHTFETWEKHSGLLLHDLRSYKTIAALLAPLFPGIISVLLAAAGK